VRVRLHVAKCVDEVKFSWGLRADREQQLATELDGGNSYEVVDIIVMGANWLGDSQVRLIKTLVVEQLIKLLDVGHVRVGPVVLLICAALRAVGELRAELRERRVVESAVQVVVHRQFKNNKSYGRRY